MYLCLLCNKNEPARGPDADFVCSHCVQRLVKSRVVDLVDLYDKALRENDARAARALASFVPRQQRRKIEENHRGKRKR